MNSAVRCYATLSRTAVPTSRRSIGGCTHVLSLLTGVDLHSTVRVAKAKVFWRLPTGHQTKVLPGKSKYKRPVDVRLGVYSVLLWLRNELMVVLYPSQMASRPWTSCEKSTLRQQSLRYRYHPWGHVGDDA